MTNVNNRNKRVIKLLCRIINISTQSYYQANKRFIKDEMSQDLIIQEVLNLRQVHKRVGTRKMLTHIQEFGKRIGFQIGRDAFFRLLEEHNLLIRNHRRNAPITTLSKHRYKRYPNIIIGVVPTRSNQIWVSDITYVEVEKCNYAYLSLVTDMYSRKIVGFCLNKNLSAEGPLQALKMAINSSNKAYLQMLIHHSDRGVQYCCNDYINLLKENEINISMTRNGDPLENAIAERVNGIIKNEYQLTIGYSFKTLENKITEAIFHYNNYRKHLSIEGMTPSEAHQKTGDLKRHWKTHYKASTTTKETQVF